MTASLPYNRIIIVDDDKHIDVTGTMPVTIIRDPRDLIESVMRNPEVVKGALIVLDHFMPMIDGDEVAYSLGNLLEEENYPAGFYGFSSMGDANSRTFNAIEEGFKDKYVEPDDFSSVCPLTLKLFNTPGHIPSLMCLLKT